MNQTELILEMNQIREMLKDFAMSEQAKQELEALTPFLDERVCRQKMEETTQARKILDALGSPPLASMLEIVPVLELSAKGAMLTPGQLTQTAVFLASCRRMKQYCKRAEILQVPLAWYGQELEDLPELYEELDASIHNETVTDAASTSLRQIRRQIELLSTQIRRKLEDLLRGRKQIFSDGYYSQRGGRYVLPVKREYRSQIKGSVVDVSASGATCFIEPESVQRLQAELAQQQIEEDNEIRRVLYMLTGLVEEHAGAIRRNVKAMVVLDVAFAKAKLSAHLKASPAVIDTQRTIQITAGRHPLLQRERCVPLDFTLGPDTRGIVITGPNTGGKTVALKTVGLFSLMAQCGLHIPAEQAKLTMNSQVLCDIGDGQSISENLSTFSAHITRITEILCQAGPQCLVLLDELGSGTDPAEGMGLAVAILEELRRCGCLFVATTHYPEVKEYARQAQGIVNARMAFDRESLRPLYRLEIGQSGESCAFYIAHRLGFPESVLQRAKAISSGVQSVASPAETRPNLAQTASSDAGDLPNPRRKPGPRIVAERPERQRPGSKFQVGDSVVVYPEKTLGIVFAPADDSGKIGVQVQKRKFYVNHRRIKLKTPASQLYPENYDFSILFDTVQQRKARHQMEKRHVPGLEIVEEDQEPPSR